MTPPRSLNQTMRQVGGFVLVGFTGLVLAAQATAAAPRDPVAKVERVSDGDSLIAVTSNHTKLRLRLLGIDAPEVPHADKLGQPFGEEVRDYPDHLIDGKTVRVDTYWTCFHWWRHQKREGGGMGTRLTPIRKKRRE